MGKTYYYYYYDCMRHHSYTQIHKVRERSRNIRINRKIKKNNKMKNKKNNTYK